jgi:hypothetical protein
MIRFPSPTATATSLPATSASIASVQLASIGRTRGPPDSTGTGDAGIADPEEEGGGTVGRPDATGWETAVQAKNTMAALLRHGRIRRIARVEATLPP